jgi:hypothetical protein
MLNLNPSQQRNYFVKFKLTEKIGPILYEIKLDVTVGILGRIDV